MPNKHLSDDEKKLLEAAMQDVKPIRKKALLEPELPKRRRPKIGARAPMQEAPPMDMGKGSADKGTIQKLKSGEFAIDAKLDLHGMTEDEAYKKLVVFIDFQHRKHSRCLLVITGKGGAYGQKGLLQREVPRWLQLSDMARRILVVSQAAAKHGGQGALYVLLRRAK